MCVGGARMTSGHGALTRLHHIRLVIAGRTTNFAGDGQPGSVRSSFSAAHTFEGQPGSVHIRSSRSRSSRDLISCHIAILGPGDTGVERQKQSRAAQDHRKSNAAAHPSRCAEKSAHRALNRTATAVGASSARGPAPPRIMGRATELGTVRHGLAVRILSPLAA